MSSEKPQPPPTQGAQREADIYDLLAWFEVNKKRLLIVAIAATLIGFAIATFRYMREQKELKASGQLLSLRATLNTSTNAIPPQASDFLKVAENFSGTAAAERARFLAATTLFTQGKYAEAESEFSRFTKEFSGSPWLANAAYGIAVSQEAQQKAEAFASYQTVVTAHANSAVADDAKLALARIHESRNQPDQALRIYNELTASKPGAAPGEGVNPAALARKEALLRAHPQLNTNAVATPSAPPPPVATGTNKTLGIAPSTPPTNSVAK